MDIVRKQLAIAQAYPANLRYDADNDVVQYSPDGGASWIDSPQSDPRNIQNVSNRGNLTMCDAVAAIIAVLKQLVDAYSAQIDNVTSTQPITTAFLAILALFIPEIIVLVALIDAAIYGIVQLYGDTVDAAFTPAVYDSLTCDIMHFMDNDGTLPDDARRGQLEAYITAHYDPVIALVVTSILEMMGTGGFNTVAAKGVAAGGCDDCGGCVGVLDFLVAPYNSYLHAFGEGQTYPAHGLWVAGAGWEPAASSGGIYDIGIELPCSGMGVDANDHTYNVLFNFYVAVNSTASYQISQQSNPGYINNHQYNNNTGTGNKTLTAVNVLQGVDRKLPVFMRFGIRSASNSAGRLRSIQIVQTS